MAERRTSCGLLGLWLALAMSAGFGSSLAFAQEQHEASTSDLAKAAQNPIADMISVPFQNNFNFHVGPHDQLQDILNIQPVIPITLDRDWNLITRWITPVISQPPLTVTGDREFGLGRHQPELLLLAQAADARHHLGHRPDLRVPDRHRQDPHRRASTRSARPSSP